MKEPDVRDWLEDLERNLSLAAEFCATIDYAEFEADIRTQYAVIRALEVAGESVKRLPDSITALEPAVPWKAIAGMRDRLIRSYDVVNLALVWSTARTTIPGLLPLVATLKMKVEDRRK